MIRSVIDEVKEILGSATRPSHWIGRALFIIQFVSLVCFFVPLPLAAGFSTFGGPFLVAGLIFLLQWGGWSYFLKTP